MMKKTIILMGVFLLLFNSNCKKGPQEKTALEMAPLVGIEIDTQKIKDTTGVKFKVLQTKTIGYMPLHKFYWISLEEKANSQQLENLASAIIREIISLVPNTYHSFKIHIFLESALKKSVEESEPFAQATFLPEGSWLKVGRIPIDGYESYVLSCTIQE